MHHLTTGAGSYFIAPYFCANFVYDLNGKKGPNTVGKDIGFITVLNPSDPTVVAPYLATNDLGDTTYAIKPNDNSLSASQACQKYSADYRLPNLDEAMAMAINYKSIQTQTSNLANNSHWTSSLMTKSSGIYVSISAFDSYNLAHKFRVWCVKR